MKDIDKILNNLRRQCSRREYCTSDVQKKAEKALDGDPEKAAEGVNILVAENYGWMTSVIVRPMPARSLPFQAGAK